ncbi:MAG: RluA family pseudouridine synthase [Bacteroidales bacterium]|nr:RluA family pseudouridine synthase [Bacteroidales bacterium]
MFDHNNILFEDNHIIIINKESGQLVQPDKEENQSLEEEIKNYIKERDRKPGNVFLGVIHRIDRPVSGIVLFAKTSKALARLNQMQQERKIIKIYWAITANIPDQTKGTLEHYIVRNESKNISYVRKKENKNAKLAVLNYEIIGKSDLYYLWKIELLTGRHHQIRCQLAHIQCPIRGDVKYGFPRSNHDKSISLHARSIHFLHPISNKEISIVAPVPNEKLWKIFEKSVND